MRLKITIQKSLEPRRGTSSRGEWVFSPLLITWEQEGNNGTYEQASLAEVSGELDAYRVQKAIETKELIDANIYFGCREHDGRYYNDIKLQLPKEFLKEGGAR